MRKLENIEIYKILKKIARRIILLYQPRYITKIINEIKKTEMYEETEDYWERRYKAKSDEKKKNEKKNIFEKFNVINGIIFKINTNNTNNTLKNEIYRVGIEYKKIARYLNYIEVRSILYKDTDKMDAIMHINAGQGGVDSQDFAKMLLKMYKRYGERRGYSQKNIDIQYGEESGIKSAVLHIEGKYAYGYLKTEVGVHRLVRISPFDTNSRRHTSFVSVWVLPDEKKEIIVTINDKDLKIDTYRATGAGGQHINKTDSAVRITHIPTNLVVTCQAERSQIKNKNIALSLLKNKLYNLEVKKRLDDKKTQELSKKKATFGSQIRNYILSPYRLIKDVRTGYESGSVDQALDGNIQSFINKYLILNK